MMLIAYFIAKSFATGIEQIKCTPIHGPYNNDNNSVTNVEFDIIHNPKLTAWEGIRFTNDAAIKV